MNNFNNKKDSYINAFNPKQNDALIETNVLIREEAEFIARNLVSLNNDSRFSSAYKKDEIEKNQIISHLDKLDKQSFDNSQKIMKLQEDFSESKNLLKKIENLLINNMNESSINKQLDIENNESNFTLFDDVNDTQKTNHEAFSSSKDENNISEGLNLFKDELGKVFNNFESHMETIIGNLTDVVSKVGDKTNHALSQKEFNDSLISNDLERFDAKSQNDDVPMLSINANISNDSRTSEKELFESFENLLNLKLDDANSKIESLTNEIKFTKDNFNNFINDYQLNLDTINSQQRELNSYFANNSSSFVQELTINKQNYEKIENEIEKICSAWAESNRLLNKLEGLIYEISITKFGFDEDLNSLISEIRDQTVQNKKSLSKLNDEIASVKDKIEQLNINHNELAEITFDNKTMIENIESDIKIIESRNISSFSSINKKLEEHDEKIEDLSIKVEDLISVENFLDTVLSSKIFQKSLESKITNMICENNNYIGDEFKFRIDHLNNKLDTELSDVKYNQKNINQTIQSIENKLYDVSSDVSLMDKKYNVKDQIDVIENKFGNLYNSEIEKIKGSISSLENHIDNFSLNDHEVSEMIRNSSELSMIIRDKIYQVLDEKLVQFSKDIDSISENIEDRIKEHNFKNISAVVDEKIVQNASKIKNEALSSIYDELTKRDQKIDLNSQEIIRNYETMLRCNTILEEIGYLVSKQSEEFNEFKSDKEDFFEILSEKVASQKQNIENLQNLLSEQIINFDFYRNNTSIKKAFDIWKNDLTSNIIELVKRLVEDEIKRKSTLSYLKDENKEVIKHQLNNSDSDFFASRVKDILSRLDNENLKKTFREKVMNLNFKINDLRKENPDIKDDDLNWFYEKEYNEYVSSKRKEN